MINRILIAFILTYNISAETVLLLDKFKSDVAPTSASFLLNLDQQASQSIEAKIIKISTTEATSNYYIYAYTDLKPGVELSYCALISSTGSEQFLAIQNVNTNELLWSNDRLNLLEAIVAEQKNKALVLIEEKKLQTSRIRALKADAASLVELNRIASAKLRAKELLLQKNKLDYELNLISNQLQQAVNMKEAANPQNRIHELELSISELRKMYSEQEAKLISSGQSSGQVEEQLKIIEETSVEDLNLLELELENLRIERERLELDDDL